MDFTVAAASSTRKNVSLNFSAEDVAAAIDRVIAARRKTLSLPGFRVGKVPAAIVEKRFGDEIFPAATQEALDSALGEVLEKEKLHPLSGVELDNPEGIFSRGTAYSCVMSFDVLPDIEFPAYEGLAISQTKAVASEKEVDDIIANIRSDLAELVDMPIARLPEDGDQADVTYKGFDEKGEPVPGVEGNFTVILGKKQVLDDFEKLVKTTLPGEEKEGPVSFPADYGHAPVAGKTITMRVKVNSLKARKEPELNDELAKKAGVDDLAKLRASIAEHIVSNKKQGARVEALKKLLDELVPKATFDLPASLVDVRVSRAVAHHNAELQKDGKKADDSYADTVRPDIEKELRPQVFLMALARKEGLEVNSQEIELQIYQMAMRAGQDYKKMSDLYRRAGLTNDIHDRLLADKALDFIYSKANVTEVEETPAA